MDDLAVAADFAAAPAGGFFWAAPPSLQPQAPVQSVVAASAPNPCMEISSSVDCGQEKEQPTNKRPRSESTTESSTKASREKIRRDKLNERFLELGAILEPGKTPKMDKTAILSDAIRVVGELRSEAKKAQGFK